MQCQDTSGQLPAIRLEHVDTKAMKKINRALGILKAAFQGNGRITLIFSGGHIDKYEITITPLDDDKK